MPREVMKNFIRTRVGSKKACAKGSFRTVKRGATRIVVCCKKGQWSRKTKRCRGSMRAQSILRRRRARR